MNILKQEYTLVLTAARHGQSATVAWLPGQQGTGRTVDARERHPSQHKRRFKVTTDLKHSLPIAPNLLDRNFTHDAPNQVWASDPST